MSTDLKYEYDMWLYRIGLDGSNPAALDSKMRYISAAPLFLPRPPAAAAPPAQPAHRESPAPPAPLGPLGPLAALTAATTPLASPRSPRASPRLSASPALSARVSAASGAAISAAASKPAGSTGPAGSAAPAGGPARSPGPALRASGGPVERAEPAEPVLLGPFLDVRAVLELAAAGAQEGHVHVSMDDIEQKLLEHFFVFDAMS